MIGDSYGDGNRYEGRGLEGRDGNRYEGKDSTKSSIPTYLTLSLEGTDMNKMTNETLLLRFHGEPFSNQLCNELLSRLNRVSELEVNHYERDKLLQRVSELEKTCEVVNDQNEALIMQIEDSNTRLDRIKELEAENSVLREMNCALNASSIAGKKAFEKLERIRELPYYNYFYNVEKILAEEG